MSSERNWNKQGDGKTWNPKKDENGKDLIAGEDSVLDGYYLSFEENKGKHNSTVYKIKDDDGQVWSAWGSAVLDDKMAGIEPGDYVRIQWLGLQDPKNVGGSQYHGWDVFVDDDAAPFGGSVPKAVENNAESLVSDDGGASGSVDDDLPF